MKIKHLLLSAITVGFLSSCQNTNKKEDVVVETDTTEVETTDVDDATTQKETYVAELSSLNSDVTGTDTQGTATFVIENDEMHVTIDVENAPAGIEHWQHFHGFKNGDVASCATADADKNNDGIVDLMETEASSGTTMVPFNELPAKMDVPANTYPTADDQGSYHYEVTIPMNELETAFADAFGDSGIMLENRVLYVHGVPTDTELPASVASLGDIPATTTLPIACGKINKQ